MEEENIILMKDNTYKITKNKVYHKNSKYTLIPVGDKNHSYVMIEPFSFMNDIVLAQLSFEIVFVEHNYLDGDEPKETHHYLERTFSEYYSYKELVMALHSLNRMRFTNKISNSNEAMIYDLAEFTYFNLQINTKEKKIFQYKFVGSGYDKFGPEDILTKIEKIYNPIELTNMIQIKDSNWNYTKHINNTGLIGIFLPVTKSISFFESKQLCILSEIKSVYCASMMYNKSEFNLDYEIEEFIDSMNELITDNDYEMVGFRFYDNWTHILADSIEYITFLPSIYSNLMVAAEFEEFKSVQAKMYMLTEFIIETYEHDGINTIKVNCDNDSILTLSDFINLLIKKNNNILVK